MKIILETHEWTGLEYLALGDLKMLKIAISNMAKRDDNTEKSQWIVLYRKIERIENKLKIIETKETMIGLVVPYQPIQIARVK